MTRTLAERLAGEIRESGPMQFARFVERALYDRDHGFYATTGRAGGRQGDFVTSVEVGPLFAAIMADALDQQWERLGRPAPFRVAEVGAGVGTLFRGIHRAQPACFEALIYTLVESSAAMQVAHQSLPSAAWRSATELPTQRHHVVLANELLDNLPFGIAEKSSAGWRPVQVALRDDDLALEVGTADPALAHLDALAPEVQVGARVPVAIAAADWVAAAKANTDCLVIFDYGASTAELAERGQPGWLRTYAGHQRGSDPLAHVGRLDITHDVPVDQLPAATRMATQAEWLREHGLDERVRAARETWTERAHIGDLPALAARSAVSEAEALTDPSGLGSFLVLEWQSGSDRVFV